MSDAERERVSTGDRAATGLQRLVGLFKREREEDTRSPAEKRADETIRVVIANNCELIMPPGYTNRDIPIRERLIAMLERDRDRVAILAELTRTEPDFDSTVLDYDPSTDPFYTQE